MSTEETKRGACGHCLATKWPHAAADCTPCTLPAFHLGDHAAEPAVPLQGRAAGQCKGECGTAMDIDAARDILGPAHWWRDGKGYSSGNCFAAKRCLNPSASPTPTGTPAAEHKPNCERVTHPGGAHPCDCGSSSDPRNNPRATRIPPDTGAELERQRAATPGGADEGRELSLELELIAAIAYGATKCRGCGVLLSAQNLRVADCCPCNSGRGINHGLVPKNTCTCDECDPEQTGSTRYPIPKPSPAPAVVPRCHEVALQEAAKASLGGPTVDTGQLAVAVGERLVKEVLDDVDDNSVGVRKLVNRLRLKYLGPAQGKDGGR